MSHANAQAAAGGLFDLLRELCSIPAPVGYEEPVHRFMADRWAPQVESIWSTPVGNLIAHVPGTGPKLMLLAHGDEIGFTVKSISEDGFLFLTSGQRQTVDRPDFRAPYALPMGQPAVVVTSNGTVDGVFATLTGHILTQAQRDEARLEWNDLWVDIFVSSRAEAEARGVNVGDRVVWNPQTRQFGSYITGKAMDNRVGLAVLDILLSELDRVALTYDLYLASSVQEEIGLIGAHSINREVGATLAVSIDIGMSGDVPGVSPLDVPTRLGAGPALVHKDLYAYSAKLNRHLRKVAAEAAIPLQDVVLAIAGSDSGALTREGMAASMVGIPTRYTHSPFETIHQDDVWATVRLLRALVTTEPVKLG